MTRLRRPSPQPGGQAARLTRRTLLRWVTVGLSAATLVACRQGATPASPASPARTTGAPTATGAGGTTTRATSTAAGTRGATPTRTARPPATPRALAPRVGSTRRVFQAPQVYEPHIAVDPANPDRLGAVAIAAQEIECDRCPINLVLATSADGGTSWRELPPATGSGSGDGVVAFAPDGTLYAAGLFGGVVLQRVPPGGDRAGPLVYAGRSGQADKPWLTVDPRDGALYLAYTDSTYAATQRPTTGVVLKRSADGGATWSAPIAVAPGAEEADLQAGRGAFPLGAVPLAGRGRQIAVAWCDRPVSWLEPPIERSYPWPLMVALSEDGGQTFGAPRQIGAMWGFFGAAGDERGYYLAYAAGTLGAWHLAVTRSDDGGATWETARAADLAPPGLNDLAPGVGLAPDGTLDLVSHGVADQGGFDLAAYQRAFLAGDWRDPRMYHVYYLGSTDGGRTFSAPVRLAEQPVAGTRFLRTDGRSRPGEYIGMASTDRYAYPIWIATSETGGPYAAMARVER